jgi:lipid-A-disaccharide synthase
MTGGAAFRTRHGIVPDAKLLAVLPGSRTSEIRFILPVFREAVARIAARVPGLITVLPTVPHVAARVRAATQDWPAPLVLVESEDEKYASFAAADAALAASGTVTTELALAGTPMVVGYRVGGLTYALASLIMNVRYITLVNVLLGREAVPEFVQSRCTPENLAGAVIPLMTDKGAALHERDDLDEAVALLGKGGEAPSLRAARAILEFVKKNQPSP